MSCSRTISLLAYALLINSLLMSCPAFAELQQMSDHDMGQVAGQAAFYTNYTAPSGDGSGGNPSDFGFYTLGVNGQVQLNTNIQHLQLGCGGVNGPGCDIDLNNMSLSGSPGVGSCPAGANIASCDAVLTNPFLRLAISNPNSLSTRHVAGVQLGAQNVLGLLQSGTNTDYANGINSFSGYIHVQSTTAADTVTGTISTAPAVFPVYNPGNGAANYTIHGNFTALGGVGATAGFMLTSGSFTIPGFSGISFTVPAPTVNGSRLTSITVNPSTTLPNVIIGYNPDDNDCGFLAIGACNGYGTPQYNANYSAAGSAGTYPANGTVGTQGGPVVATSTSCSGLGCLLLPNAGVGANFNTHLYGAIQNIAANVNFVQPLGFMHSLPLNSPLSLSLQSQNILWPGSPSGDIAQKGWWMSVNNPVYVGNLVPSSPINLCADPNNASTCVFPQFAQQFNNYLANNPPNTNDLFGILSGKTLGIQIGGVALTPIGISLNGVQLSSQNTMPNCYGGLKFC
ncbi:hypothetical protein [Aquirhabdus sp.]|uniref:hypothetical protein n=1 Tax=Aquirhabdus sp. TaxID=2824160 RepID=UPI00396C8B38